jgi:hypothetical protein
MSAIKNAYILKCSRCGKNYVLKELETAQPDPDLFTLEALVKQIAERGLCPRCQKVHNYAAKKALQGEPTDYNQMIITPGSANLPGPPDRIICEHCGEGNNPFRNTCRRCKKPLNPRRLYDARGKQIYG